MSDINLTDREREILRAYQNPRREFSRAVRLSFQYAIGAAIFVYLAIYDDPLWSLAVYGIFLAWIIARLVGARAVAGAMPSIINKYERRIQELERPAP